MAVAAPPSRPQRFAVAPPRRHLLGTRRGFELGDRDRRRSEWSPISIAMMGTRGVPARYGGFETAVEEIGSRLARWGHRVTVYCRATDPSEQGTTSEHLGMRLVTLPSLPVKQLETLSHTYLSIVHELRRKDRDDVVVIFNSANGFLLPLLRRAGIPVAVNTDGLEWMRGKWGRTGQSYYKLAELACVRFADRLISDSRAIQDYYSEKFGTRPEFIPYGANILEDRSSHRLTELGLAPFGYNLVVARLEPENNVEMIVAGYRASSCRMPLVIVGGNPYNPEAERSLREAARADPRIRPVGALWDQQLLDQLYLNSSGYLHGHSVGGTNPSLLRAMGAGNRVLAFDTRFNREVLEDLGSYFSSQAGLTETLDRDENNGRFDADQVLSHAAAVRDRVRTAYNWDSVAARYLHVCRQLVSTHSEASVTPM